MVGPRISIKTFYLSSVYSGTTRINAMYYHNCAYKVISEWFDIKILVGVVTDNTGNVKNALEMIMAEHFGVVTLQDQAHVADRLMEDIGEIQWIADTINAIVSISVHIRRFQKLKEKVKQLIQEWTANGKAKATVPEAAFPIADEMFRAQMGVQVDKTELVAETSERSSLMSLGREGQSEIQSMVNESLREDEERDEAAETIPTHPAHYAPGISKTPKHMKRLSRVRFASAKKLLVEIRSLIPVLKIFVTEPSFHDLLSNNKESEKQDRLETLVFPIMDK